MIRTVSCSQPYRQICIPYVSSPAALARKTEKNPAEYSPDQLQMYIEMVQDHDIREDGAPAAPDFSVRHLPPPSLAPVSHPG